ncbi:hypothetical protein PSECIP111854_03063 [Pseudoalteromonas sp. CIP111854]|uniref:Uncharacterized protein n=1 Tax=Pseudoalteromonas holothuriae TaxID=2963714 RepID=A0A9W4R1B6_9GAMM|nr:hypothetical protein [Pseudoalteromonas sp. CIP111854]CAH9062679.1 hypothetical protein PSECIP111854_03063 [Pseudoalteromonas sp. CIP111854]
MSVWLLQQQILPMGLPVFTLIERDLNAAAMWVQALNIINVQPTYA